MPRVSYLKTQAVKLAEALRQINTEVGRFLSAVASKPYHLHQRWGKSPSTCSSRFKNPEKLTLEEIAEICIKCDAHCNMEFLIGSTVTKISW